MREVEEEEKEEEENAKDAAEKDENKKAFFRLMLEVWSSKKAAPFLKDKTVIIIVDGVAYELKSDGSSVTKTEIPEIRSNQEQTDTRTILYLLYVRNTGNFKTAVVRSPDSDEFFLLLHYAHPLHPLEVLLDIGMGDHRRMINMTELGSEFGPDFCTVLLGTYVFTGKDTTSAFKGKGKVVPVKKLQNLQKY